jgi:carboxylesterase
MDMNKAHDINLAGGEDAVLLLHGLAGSPLEMRYVANALHKRGFSVVVPHIAGYGYGGGATDWREWQRSVLHIFEELKCNYRTVSVGGLCIGAVLALSLAAEKSSDIAALSLLSTTLFYDGWALPWYRFLLPLGYYTPLRHVYSFRERHPYGIKNQVLRKKIIRSLHRGITEAGAARISMNHIYQATRLIRHVIHRMRAIKAPTLVIHAIHDDTSSTKSADFVVKHIGSKNVRTIFLHDSYHIVTLDNEREVVASETHKFFVQNTLGNLRGEIVNVPAAELYELQTA